MKDAPYFKIDSLHILNRMFLLVVAVWTALICGMLAWHLHETQNFIQHVAYEAASENIQKDILYRIWAAGHGGVYVPVTGNTPPNPYLKDVKERDLTTPSGRKLTLINPAYMTRQVHELAKGKGGVRGRITSLRPIRPENHADAWEEKALKAFERGSTEYGELVMMDGASHYRLMSPLFIQESCLKCHASQGYKLGDLRGGVSAAVPMKDYDLINRSHLASEIRHFGAVWLLGLAGVLLAKQYIKQRIGEQQKAVARLEESEQRMRSIVDNAPFGSHLYRLEQDGRLIFVGANAAADRILGLNNSRFVGKTIEEAFPPLADTRVPDTYRRVAVTGIPEEFNNEYNKDEIRGTFEVHVFPTTANQVAVFFRDITERKMADSALRQSEERFRSIVDTSLEGIITIDDRAAITFLNARMIDMLGYSQEEVMGRSILDFVHADERQDHEKQLELRRQGLATEYERRFLRKDGSVLWTRASASPLADEPGTYCGAFGMFTDVTERKQAEEALQESEKKYRDLVETSQDLIWTCNAKGRFTYLNPSWERVLGYTIEEMLGRRLADFQVPDVAARDLREFIKHLADGTIMGYETTCRSRSGKDVRLIFNAKSLRNAAGAIVGTQGTAFDITEHKKTEKNVRLDHRRMVSLLKISQSKSSALKELLDQALDEAVALSESGLGYIYYYDEEKKEFTLHSWSRNVMKECSISDPPKTYQLEKTGIWGEAVRQRGPVIVNDFYAPHPLKRGYPEGHAALHRFMTLPVFVDGRIVAVVGVANKQLEYDEQDVLQLASMMDSVWQIAEHRRVDENLRKLSHAVEQSPVSIVITDADGNIEFVNPRFTQVTGYPAAEVLGKNPRVLKSGETPPERYKELWETITAGRVWEGEFHNRKKNGDLFWEHAAISPIRDRDGTITHYLGIKEDVTERKKLEEQLHQAQKMEAIGQLAGGVAHDFNNILSTITGYASLLEMSIPSDATLREYVSEISVASERGANLTQSLLAFSRKQEASLAPVELNDQIRSSHKVLARLVGEDIDLVLGLDREDLVIEADAGQLQQVLMNLASNARDAMPNGGTLRIETRMDAFAGDHLERYALERPGKYAILSVTDTGAGMERSVRERVFEPFFTTKGVGKGTGLGLSIVYGIVRKHRGSITVDSEPGKGTAFSIYLPLSEQSVLGRRGDKALPLAAAGNCTILLVEDEEPVRRVLRLTLEAYGYRVIEAVDGEEAVRVFRENRDGVRLVLCDLVMPKKNGRQACEEMKMIRPDIRTIFMSGYTKDIFDQKGIIESDITLLVKPIDPKVLLRKIGEALEQSHHPS